MEFFAQRIWQPDLAITETAQWVGRQIGQFIVRKQAEDSYRELVDLSPDAILIHCDGRIVFANSAASRLLGARRAHRTARQADPRVSCIPQFHDLRGQKRSKTLQRARCRAVSSEMTYLRLDGSPVHVEVSSRYFVFEGKPAVQAIVRDVSDRKAAERKIIRLSNLYAALSQTNKAITRLSEQQILLHEVCRIAVEYGAFELAAIVMIDPQTLWVKPVAAAGRAAGLHQQRAHLHRRRASPRAAA